MRWMSTGCQSEQILWQEQKIEGSATLSQTEKRSRHFVRLPPLCEDDKEGKKVRM